MELDQKMLQAARDERMNETGEMPPCPFCGRPRVQRSDYVRCNQCGVNWLDGEDMGRDPKIERYAKMVEAGRAQLRQPKNAV